MADPERDLPARSVLCATALGTIFLLSILIRLQDPLGTSALPGIDPYRHMMFTHRFLDGGKIGYYPPGLSAVLAVYWTYTGTDLYAIVRFAPVLLGGIGVLGMGLLLWRHLGPMPSIAGSLGYAVLPGFIKFTTKMTPTAVDLALVPFLFYAVLEILRGRLRYSALAVPITLLFVVAHPWFQGLLTASILLFILLWLVFWDPSMGQRPLTPLGLATVFAIMGGSLGLMMTRLGGITRRVDTLMPSFMQPDWTTWVVLAAALVPLSAVLAFPRAIDRLYTWRARRSLPIGFRLGISIALLVATTGITLIAFQQGLPRYVDFPRRFGWPALLLGAAAFLFLPFHSSRIGTLGAGFAAVTYPLSLFDIYDTWFIPFRISFFFGIGLMLLVAVAVRQLVLFSERMTTTLHLQKGSSRQMVALALPLSLVAAGTVYETTPEPSEWYRIQSECGVEAIQEVSDMLNQEPDALLLTGNLGNMRIARAFTYDTSRVWHGDWFMRDYDWQKHEIVKMQEKKNAPIYLLIDPVNDKVPLENLSFLDETPWQKTGTWCPEEQGDPTILLYTSGPAYTSCQLEALKDIAGQIDQDPDTLVITGSWISRTVLDVYLDETGQVWSGNWWLNEYDTHRYDAMRMQKEKEAPLYVLIDPHTDDEVAPEDRTFLQDGPWEPHAGWCAVDPDRPTITLHTNQPPGP